MQFGALLILAVGLSMDAFAVAICKGLALRRITPGNMIIVGLWFGGFQALMPVVGYLLGVQFSDYIRSIDHWVAFALLLIIGVNMIREALSSKEEGADSSLSLRAMFVLAVATSIDALAIGVTFAFLQVNITLAVICIGLITFVLSIIGVKVGSVFGTKFRSKAEFAGGAILILLGAKILLEHLGLIAF